MDKGEFLKGIKALNTHLEEWGQGAEPLDGDQLFGIIDIDKTGVIELDEFCECFRLMSVTI